MGRCTERNRAAVMVHCVRAQPHQATEERTFAVCHLDRSAVSPYTYYKLLLRLIEKNINRLIVNVWAD